ncbi:MAG: NAD(P)-dependent alcohol dehydrogenase [Phycicoccus sp.]
MQLDHLTIRETDETMSAMAFARYGPPDVLEPMERPVPQPRHDEVLVQVAAAGVNPADAVLRAGRLRVVARLRLPFVPGADIAGTVAAVGAGVTRFRPGDRVLAMLPVRDGGGYARYAVAREEHLAALPEGVAPGRVAGLPLAGLTARQALRVGVGPGSTLLVHGGSGGVGSMAVQLARLAGADVAATAGAANAGLVSGLGATEVFDHRTWSFTGRRYDVVLDTVGDRPFRRWRPLLRAGGVLVTLNPARGNPVARSVARSSGRRLVPLMVRPDGEDLEVLVDLVGQGRLRPLVEATYPLAHAAAAHRRSETRRVRGKLVLVVDPDAAGDIPVLADATGAHR